ncbi:MAG: CopD family protein [Flavobacteriales bacterium]|nr:CopD family protein [Flavobacteriales bacterium]
MYDVLKALHIIFIVTWFSGLFYIVRLFVYQAEAKEKSDVEREILEPQYKLMAKRLWYGITWPSFIFTMILGPWLLVKNPGIFKMDYMHIKLGLVAGLVIYFFICHSMFLKLQKGKDNRKGSFYRLWNELATLFLVAIVFIIVLKSKVNWIYGTIAFFLFAILLMIAIKVYKRIRER